MAGVEISAVALESFCLEHGIAARRRILPDFDVYEADQLQLYRGDFFALTPALLGRIAAVYRSCGADFLGAGTARRVCRTT